MKAITDFFGRLTKNTTARVLFVIGVLVGCQLGGFMEAYKNAIVGARHSLVELSEKKDVLTEKGLLDVNRDIREIDGALIALNGASVLTRPAIFVYHAKIGLVKEVAKGYTFTVPLSFEGVVHAVLGGLLLEGLFRLLVLIFARKWKPVPVPAPAVP